MIKWKVAYKKDNTNEQKQEVVLSKQAAIQIYLKCLDGFYGNDINSLKIFKNDKDYTQTLNKFLYK